MLSFRRTKKGPLAMNMAPLVDMVFLLLIFFLLSSSLLQPSVRLDLPGSPDAERQEREEIIITVDHGGNIFVNLEKVTRQTLGLKLEEKMAQTGQRAVTFRGDRRISYDLFFDIADIAKRAGARQINLAHQIEIEE